MIINLKLFPKKGQLKFLVSLNNTCHKIPLKDKKECKTTCCLKNSIYSKKKNV